MPKALRLWGMLFAAILGPIAARAAEPGHNLGVSLGPGTSSCEKFTEVRAVNLHPGANASIAELNSASEAIELQGVYLTWLQGYLTAVNQQGAGLSDILAGTDLDAALAWIGRYCKKNPSLEIAAAAHEFIAFQRRKPGRKPVPPKPVAAGRPAASIDPNKDPWGELGHFPLQGDLAVAPSPLPRGRTNNP